MLSGMLYSVCVCVCVRAVCFCPRGFQFVFFETIRSEQAEWNNGFETLGHFSCLGLVVLKKGSKKELVSLTTAAATRKVRVT